MTRDKAEKLTTLFLAIFSTGLAAQLAFEAGHEQAVEQPNVPGHVSRR